MNITHHSLPINWEIIGSTHKMFMQYSQKFPKIKNEVIIVAINNKIQRFVLIYLKKHLLVILIIVKLLLQTSYRNNINSIFRTAIGILSNFCRKFDFYIFGNLVQNCSVVWLYMNLTLSCNSLIFCTSTSNSKDLP